METLDTNFSPKWDIMDPCSSPSSLAMRMGEGIVEDDHSEAEHKIEQSNGLQPTAIFQILSKADSNKLALEQNVTLFALRLALLEKLASRVGTLAFIWATTIIFGGFASNTNPVDFMVISLILVTEGVRIFSRGSELEWRHLASKSANSSIPPDDQTVKGLKLREEDHGGIKETARKEPPPSSVHDLGSQIGQHGEHIVYMQSWGTPTVTSVKPTSEEKKSMGPCETVDLEKNWTHKMYNTRRTIPSMSRPNSEENSCTTQSSYEDFPKRIVVATTLKSESTRSVRSKFLCSCTSIPWDTRGVIAVLYWVQMTSVMICFVLSCWRLLRQDFNPPAVLKKDSPANIFMSLNIFYALAPTEALLFLLKRVYWDRKIKSGLLDFVQVNGDSELENQVTIKQFFYEVYRKSIDGSVFDGLAMDIVNYSLALLQSDLSNEQLGGLRMLRTVVDRYDGFSVDALRQIGTISGPLQRLVEMLSWSTTRAQDMIRQEAATLIYKAIRYSKNSFKIAAIPGCMDGLVSLLMSHDRDHTASSFGSRMKSNCFSDLSTARRLDGLRIILEFSRDPMNLVEIGETPDLVPILVSFIVVTDVRGFRGMEGRELEIFDMALRVLATLMTARNASGTIFRPVIMRLVSGISSLRDILEFGDCHPQLQWLAIDILTNLTLEDNTRRVIRSTGGVIRNLLTLFARDPHWSGLHVNDTDETRRVRDAVSRKAGEALNLLAIMNRENCKVMMLLRDGNGMGTFIPALLGLLHEHREQATCAANILRTLADYGSYSEKQEMAVCAMRLMKLLMAKRSSRKVHEAMVGLSSRILGILDDSTYRLAVRDIERTDLVQMLLQNLEYNTKLDSKFPRVRRHSVELILTLVRRDALFFEEFMKDGLLERKLVEMVESTSEAEEFIVFSGSEGLARHAITMETLLEQSLRELENIDHFTP